MRWPELLHPDIHAFMESHAGDNVATLALKKSPVKSWPYRDILDQIKARQKAERKLPAWHAHPDVIFPAADLVEQASSEATARFKAGLFKGRVFADLTAGLGADACALLENFEKGIAVERDEKNAALLTHNLARLSKRPVSVYNALAEEVIEGLPICDLIYLDPQRRSDARRGIVRLEDCTPDVTELLPALFKKSQQILIKTSPLLDIDLASRTLGHVQQVFVVEWRGECREVLYLIRKDLDTPYENIPIQAVRIDDHGQVLQQLSFTRHQEKTTEALYALPQNYLYEPGPAFQKAGGFSFMARHYGLKKLHLHTHLYTSEKMQDDFPGRIFVIQDILQADRKALSLSKAHLTVRNFPADVAGLRKKLKLAEGGEDYLFACTLHDERKVLIHVRKQG